MSEGPMSDWRPCSAWAGFAQAGRYGASHGEPGVRLNLCEDLSLATVIAAHRQDEALQEILSARLGLALPEAGRAGIDGERRLVWSGPRQWLVAAEADALRGLPDMLRGIAAVTEQGSSRAMVVITGPNARACLAKGVAVDLHPRAFRAGSTALTGIAHMGVQLWQTDETPAYELTVARSFAGSLWAWLVEAAAEYGMEAVTA